MNMFLTQESISQARKEIYESGRVETRDGVKPDIFPTGLTAERAAFVRAAVAMIPVRRSLETGFAFGLGALAVLEGSPERMPGTHTAVDPLAGTTWGDAGRVTLERAGAIDALELIQEDSSLALPRLLLEGRENAYDFALIDGCHLFEFVLSDLVYANRLVRPGGLVVVDDLWMPAVSAATDFVVKNLGCDRLPPPVECDGAGAARHCVVLRVPDQAPDRAWDHFEPFDIT